MTEQKGRMNLQYTSKHRLWGTKDSFSGKTLKPLEEKP